MGEDSLLESWTIPRSLSSSAVCLYEKPLTCLWPNSSVELKSPNFTVLLCRVANSSRKAWYSLLFHYQKKPRGWKAVVYHRNSISQPWLWFKLTPLHSADNSRPDFSEFRPQLSITPLNNLLIILRQWTDDTFCVKTSGKNAAWQFLERENQKHLTFENLAPANVWQFCPMNDLKDELIGQIVCRWVIVAVIKNISEFCLISDW